MRPHISRNHSHNCGGSDVIKTIGRFMTHLSSASLTEIWIHIGECEISVHKVSVYLAYYFIIASPQLIDYRVKNRTLCAYMPFYFQHYEHIVVVFTSVEIDMKGSGFTISR